MIVNIRVPAMEKVYNFSINEKAPVDELIEELVELVKQKESVQFGGDMSTLTLCSTDRRIRYKSHGCVGDYGIRDGDELILV